MLEATFNVTFASGSGKDLLDLRHLCRSGRLRARLDDDGRIALVFPGGLVVRNNETLGVVRSAQVRAAIQRLQQEEADPWRDS